MSRDEAVEKVRAVYEELERRPIERACELRSECCHFKLTGETPYLTAGEALVVAEALHGSGHARLQERPEGECPLLDSRTLKCRVYEARPFGCRTHFCSAAGGPYPRRAVVDLIRRLEDVDVALGGNGGRSLPGAVRDALSTPAARGKVHSKRMPSDSGRG